MESPTSTSVPEPASPSSVPEPASPSSFRFGAPSPKNRSRSSSRASHLTLDLSNLPPLSQPSPPSNTLLITNLNNLETFHPESLQNLRNIIQSQAHILSWSPLKSLRRIICTFPSEQEALLVRQALDGEIIMGDRCRVYFGENTPTEPRDQHLQAPEAKKLFFISPPPSPPHGWEVKNEEPPNEHVLAEDLVKALLSTMKPKDRGSGDIDGHGDDEKKDGVEGHSEAKSPLGRPRSGSTILFEPGKDEKDMPAISVEDYTDSSELNTPASPRPPLISHTSRPPVELMHDT